MTELTMSYIVNPFARIWAGLSRLGSSIMYGFEMSGYARAAAQLRGMGYYEEADKCYQMMRELK